ncbi:hypothetical protein CHS0354_001314 [Potamilus streckersoni]|uniref:Uncharacterized protein n=1 Tax=Potamilus streckersoni TaxID=2493646 RepID=A0AAE0RV43_9BIVA|nr:hypothetical protein CHS0354_001314 [Potamilus streckersoni]
MMNIAWVLCVLFANSSTTRGMRTIISEVGSNINLTWTIYNRTDDLIYIDHNNYTMIKLWPEKNHLNPTPKYKDRLDFSFVKQDRELKMNLFLKDISYLDEGLYTSYIQLHRKWIETVKVIVTVSRLYLVVGTSMKKSQELYKKSFSPFTRH